MENSRAADLARVAAGVVLCAVSGELFVRAIRASYFVAPGCALDYASLIGECR